MRLSVFFFLMIFIAVLSAGCAKQSSPSAEIVAEIEKSRREKDVAFRNKAESPLPEAALKNFGGLPYFAVDLAYRFEGPIVRATTPDTFAFATSTGRIKKALRYGHFPFTFEGREYRLEVYRLLALPEHYLFIPFTDLTSGEETYGGGRYLDVTLQPDNHYVIDFNLAYNPSCAYGRTDFSCPIPPRNNHLNVRIAAGEKMWEH